MIKGIKISRKLSFVLILATIFLLFGIFSETGNKILKNIGEFAFYEQEGVLASYGYQDDPDPEDPIEEPQPEPEEEPEYPDPSPQPEGERALFVEYQSYCHSMREGEILFSWSGLDPEKEYIFQIWKDDVLIVNKENLISPSTLVYINEDSAYSYGLGWEVGFGKSYTPRVKEHGEDYWLYYDESMDNRCTLIGGIEMPDTFQNKGDCNPDGYNLDGNPLTFTTASRPFPYVIFSSSPQKLESETEITFTFIGQCYESSCSYYKWKFENASNPIIESSSTATTTFIEDRRTKMELFVRDEGGYGCSYSIERMVGLILPPRWREITPYF